jgi:hypothetical protein
MILKSYQTDALDWLEAFFKRCKPSNNSSLAHAKTTEDLYYFALTYRPIPSLSPPREKIHDLGK